MTTPEDAKCDPSELLRLLKNDVRGMEWKYVEDDGRTILIAKADVLAIIDDFISYVKDPA
jgi:hypothetical protein